MLSVIYYLLSVSSVFAQVPSYPEESEQNCSRVESNDPNSIFNEAPVYTDASGRKKPAMREDAGFDFSSSVKGIHCGQTKGTPIVLQEESPFVLDDPFLCGEQRVREDTSDKFGNGGKTGVWWMGEVGINYDFPTNPKRNLYLPFVEEMADQWAGTMDTEHLTLAQYDDLKNRANSGDIIALEEKRQRDGALRKLLPQDYQDELKCKFAKFAQKKVVLGKPTIYKGYAPDGKVLLRALALGGACRQDACPISKSDPNDPSKPDPNYNRGDCLENYDNGTTLVQGPYGPFAPGPAWEKMPLIPNEKTTGQLKMVVCEDREYPGELSYPEAMRFGLSANEIWKIKTSLGSKTNPALGTQEAFYQSGYEDLRDPLTSKELLGIYAEKPSGDQTLSQTQINQKEDSGPNSAEATLGKQAPYRTVTGQARMTKQTKPSYFSQVVSFIKKYWPKVQTAFAKTIEKYKPVNKLLAQACVPFQAEVAVVSENPFVYKVVVTRTPCAPKGVIGDVYLNPPYLAGHDFEAKDYENQRRQAGLPTGPHVVNMTTESWTFYSSNPETEPFMPKVNNAEELKKWIWTVKADRTGYGEYIPFSYGTPNAIVNNSAAVNTTSSSGCDVNTQCCLNQQCTASCDICKTTQIPPSDTTLLPKGYPAGHQLIGVDWPNGVASYNPVRLRYKIPKYVPGQTPAGCSFTAIKEDNELINCEGGGGCPDSGPYCGPGWVCGNFDCKAEHQRVIDIYNSVPFLASAWKQVADPIWGFASAFAKPLGVTGTGSLPFTPYDGVEGGNFTGCSKDQDQILDPQGNFVPYTAASFVSYDFHPSFGGDTWLWNVSVGQTSPKAGQDAKVTFYRLGGVCNANKWWTEKVLNPMLGEKRQ